MCNAMGNQNPYDPPALLGIPPKTSPRAWWRRIQWLAFGVMIFVALTMLGDIAAMFYLDSIPKTPLTSKVRPLLPPICFALVMAWGVIFAFVFTIGAVLAQGPSDKEDVENLRKTLFG
jgi:hypothetical protein